MVDIKGSEIKFKFIKISGSKVPKLELVPNSRHQL